MRGNTFPPSNSEWFKLWRPTKLWVLPEGKRGRAATGQAIPTCWMMVRFEFQVLSQGQRCEISLEGASRSPRRGCSLREPWVLARTSPRIKLSRGDKERERASDRMVRAIGFLSTITADAKDSSRHNQNFLGFQQKRVHRVAILNRYHVKFGPAENTAAQVAGERALRRALCSPRSRVVA